jgi:hypothetical protein
MRGYPGREMERGRATWTDERLDDLARRVDRGFERVDRELAALRGRIDAHGTELSDRIDAVGSGLSDRIDALSDRVDARIDGLQRTMIQVGGGLVAAMLATLVTVLVAVISTHA